MDDHTAAAGRTFHKWDQLMDVLLFQTENDGDVDKAVTTTNGIETALYLSLFGGNRDDEGAQDSNKGWWGNILEDDPVNKLVSETAFLLGTIPATTFNLNRIKAAAERDLMWVTSTGVAQEVTVGTSLSGLNKVQITVSVDGVDYKYTEDWQ